MLNEESVLNLKRLSKEEKQGRYLSKAEMSNLASKLAPNETNLGLFKISFSTFCSERFVTFGANLDAKFDISYHEVSV